MLQDIFPNKAHVSFHLIYAAVPGPFVVASVVLLWNFTEVGIP